MKNSARSTALIVVVVTVAAIAFAQKSEQPPRENRVKSADKPPEKSADENAELKKDLENLQGSWQRVSIDRQGNVGKRQEKVIKGNLETLTRYDLDNNVESTHTVEFKLERSGDVKLFTFARPGQIDDPQSQTSYIYKLDGDIFYDVPGLLVKRRSYSNEPAIYEWVRLRIPKLDEPEPKKPPGAKGKADRNAEGKK